MKKIFLTIISAAAILTGCNQEVIMQDGKGTLALELNCKLDYTEVETKAIQTDEEIINGLSIDIVRPFDGWKVNYTPFSSIKGKVVELGSGSYILTASSPVKEEAAFDQPIFEGSKGFDIAVGEVTNISLQCTITNLKVDVKLSENFVNELSDYTVTVSNGKANLIWVKNSVEDHFEPAAEDGKTFYVGKKSGYFKVAPLTITVDGHRKIDNTSASTSYTITEVAAANHHIICLDAQVIGTLGGIDITISDKVNPIEQPVVVPGFEEVPVPGDDPADDENNDNGSGDNGSDDNGSGDNGSGDNGEVTPSIAPTLVWTDNSSFAPVNIPSEIDATLIINSPSPITEFAVTVVSDTDDFHGAIAELTGQGQTMDMINNTVLQEKLIAFGVQIPMGDDIKGKLSVTFPITSFLGLINGMYEPDAGDRHNFTLRVVNEAGGVLEQTLTFISVATATDDEQ